MEIALGIGSDMIYKEYKRSWMASVVVAQFNYLVVLLLVLLDLSWVILLLPLNCMILLLFWIGFHF
jgi:hypothetical protein